MLVARASGRPLEQFLRERVFDPFGMKDTGFRVPAAKRDRLASSYAHYAEIGGATSPTMLALAGGVAHRAGSRTASTTCRMASMTSSGCSA